MLAMVLRAVGDSEFIGMLKLGCLFCGGEKEGKAVCRDNLGFLDVGGRVNGIADSMVPATCHRKSEVSGDSCRPGLDGDKSLAGRVGLGVGERMGKTSMSRVGW